LAFDQSVNRIWADIPVGEVTNDSTRVTYEAGTEPVCGSSAIRMTRYALAEGEIGPDALKALKVTFKMVKTIGIPLGGAGDVADLIIKYYESDSPEEFAEKLGDFLAGKAASRAYGAANKELPADSPFKDNPYGKTAFKEAAKQFYKSFFDHNENKFRLERGWVDPTGELVNIVMDLHKNANGLPELFLQASGDCKCKWPTAVHEDQKLHAWQVRGFAQLIPGTPIVKAASVTIPWSLGGLRYETFAKCGDCSPPSMPAEPTAISVGPCARVTRDIQQAKKIVDQSATGLNLKRLEEAALTAFNLAVYSKDPDEQRRANAEYKELVAERKLLERKKEDQIRDLVDKASQSWSKTEKACYSYLDTDFTISCSSLGTQLRVPKYETNVQIGSVPAHLRYTVTTHCGSVTVFISVDGKLIRTSDFLGYSGAAGPTAVDVELSAISPGNHRIALQAEGRPGGCVGYSLGSWGGHLKISASR